MTKEQESSLGMALKVKNFYAKNTLAISVLAAVVPFFTQLGTLISELITADTGSRADITGYALMKASKRKALETLAQKVSNAIASYALIEGDVVLQKRADYTASSWYLFTEKELITEASIVSNLATPLASSLATYMVTAAEVSSLATSISSFINIISDPTLAIDSRKEDNIAVVQKIDAIKTLLTGKIDVLMRGFEVNNPSLYSKYNSARAIDINGSVTAPTAVVELAPATVKTVHTAASYDADTFYTIENKGTLPVYFSLSTADNTVGSDEVLLEAGQTRVRLASNLAPIGVFLVVNNPNAVPASIRVWVE